MNFKSETIKAQRRSLCECAQLVESNLVLLCLCCLRHFSTLQPQQHNVLQGITALVEHLNLPAQLVDPVLLEAQALPLVLQTRMPPKAVPRALLVLSTLTPWQAVPRVPQLEPPLSISCPQDGDLDTAWCLGLMQAQHHCSLLGV